MIIVELHIRIHTMKSLYENVQELRKKPATAYVGMRYSKADDKEIMQQAADGVSIDEIARSQKRTIQAIRNRIAILALRMMKEHGLALEDISRMYNINMILLTRIYQRECEKEAWVTRMIRDACCASKCP